MKIGECKICGAITHSWKKTKNYCGDPGVPGDCAYVNARATSKEWNRKNYIEGQREKKLQISSVKVKTNWRKDNGTRIEIGWLNG